MMMAISFYNKSVRFLTKMDIENISDEYSLN